MKWRDKTLICLRDEISRSYVANAGPPCDCAAIQSAAVASHTVCYTKQPSFCELEDGDIQVVARTVEIADIRRLGVQGVTETARTLVVCRNQMGIFRAASIARLFLSEKIKENAEEAYKFVKEALDRAIEIMMVKGDNEGAAAYTVVRDDLVPPTVAFD